jgi:hypothetical protein
VCLGKDLRNRPVGVRAGAALGIGWHMSPTRVAQRHVSSSTDGAAGRLGTCGWALHWLWALAGHWMGAWPPGHRRPTSLLHMLSDDVGRPGRPRRPGRRLWRLATTERRSDVRRVAYVLRVANGRISGSADQRSGGGWCSHGGAEARDANNARRQRPATEGNWRVPCSCLLCWKHTRPWFPTDISARAPAGGHAVIHPVRVHKQIPVGTPVQTSSCGMGSMPYRSMCVCMHGAREVCLWV